jgi:hypothetical protein
MGTTFYVGFVHICNGMTMVFIHCQSKTLEFVNTSFTVLLTARCVGYEAKKTLFQSAEVCTLYPFSYPDDGT